MSARILVVGEDNPHGADPRMALYYLPRQASGNRLRLVMGLSDRDYLRHLERVNLCAGRWSTPEARARAAELLDGRYPVVILLGSKVRAAAGIAVLPRPCSWIRFTSGVIAACLPHPSGRCRYWNEPQAILEARLVLEAAAPWVPWGSSDADQKLAP